MKLRWILCCCALVVMTSSPVVFAQSRISAAGGKGSDRGECPRQCHAAAKELIADCVEQGGTHRDCVARGQEFERNCRSQCDHPQNCESKCEAHAREVLRGCIAAGGAEQDCQARAREAHQQCLIEHCAPPGGCEEICRRHAVAAFNECLASGVAELDCIHRARNLFHNCVSERCAPPPDCQLRCRQDAAMVKQLCLEAGGSEERCSTAAEEFFAACVQEHCAPRNCEEACTNRAVHVYRECIENGGSQEDCAMRARAFLAGCLQEVCEPPPTCEERCHRLARSALAMCLQLGGSQEDCEARAQEVLGHCIQEECTEPPTCEERCTREARHLYEECVAAGGAPDDCEARAHEALGNCIEERCQRPSGCEDQCRRIAELVGRLCLQLGGSEDTCAARAHNFLESCLGLRCDPSTCRALCHLESHKIYLKCLAGGGSDENCSAVANQALEECLHGCERPQCGGFAGTPCPDGQFCQFPPGTCDVSDRAGACMAIPVDCPDVFNPVCGCDGMTYGNACKAAMVGQSIAHEGPCHEICGTIVGIPCDKGEFCKFPPGTCEFADHAGECVPIPTGCPDVWNPVCGCDGMTYGNECEANAAGVSIDHAGPCLGMECAANEECGEGSFCLFELGDCGQAAGHCTPRPGPCPEVFSPVCGCNGKTYVNRCFAHEAGISVAHEGPCPEVCGGIAGEVCDGENEYCHFRIGTCGEGDVQGLCRERPEACPLIFDPVCGCDGQTYSNECFAAMAGVSIEHEGPCLTSCEANETCPEGQWCRFRDGECGKEPGACIPRPHMCPGISEPVCGCDGHTYRNRCLAAAAGVSVAHTGECR